MDGRGGGARRRTLGTKVSILVAVVGAVLPSPGSGHPLIDPSPDAKIMIVSANLRESHAEWPDDITGVAYSDMQTMGEIANFVDHLAEHTPSPPDVLLLQEVIAPSARETAVRLSEKFDLPYQVVIAGDYSNEVARDSYLHKRNVAIIVNAAQIEVVGKVGFLTLLQRPGDWPSYLYGIAQDQAHALLRDRSSGERLAVMSIHWATNPKFVSEAAATARRVEWAHQTKSFMINEFNSGDAMVMGGEFNFTRCGAWRESLGCDEHPAYEVLAKGAFKDAVLALHRGSPKEFGRQVENRNDVPHRIDYVFVTGEIQAASRSVDYETEKYTPRFFSDHKYDWALIGS
jgi:exonuclease III